MSSTTLDTMRDVLKRRFGIEDAQLDENTPLATLGLDSLAFIEYSFELEKELHITLPDLPRDMATIGDLVRFVDGERSRQTQGIAAG